MALAFLDTNVLLYAARPVLGRDDEAKRAVALDLLLDGDFLTSGQVMAEFYHNAVKQGDQRLTPQEAEEWLNRIAEQRSIAIDAELVKFGAAISQRYKLSYWDGAMLAAANMLTADTFYTEDLNDGQRYGGVTAINPFKHLSN